MCKLFLRRCLALLAAIAVVPALGGCIPPLLATGAGMSAFQAGGAAYITGELESAEVTEMHALFEVVQEVLVEEFAFEIHVARAGANHAFVHVRETQGRTIRISLERKSPIVTKINIRIGLFGDQPMSRLLLAGIQSRLPAPPHRHPSLDAVLRAIDENGQPKRD